MDYAMAKAYHDAARNPADGKPIANNTRVMCRPNGGKPSYAVLYHRTDILTFHADESWTVDADGWHTITTSGRMNDYLPPGFRVMSVKGRLHLFRLDAANPIRTMRRRRTYQKVERFYTQPIYGEAPDPDVCVCGAHKRDHRLAHYSRPNGQEPGPCQAESYMHSGRQPWGHKCDCPGFLANPRATKRGVVGEEQHSYMDREPVGWERYEHENPWRDLGELNRGGITVKNGKIVRVGPPKAPRTWRNGTELGWHCIGVSRLMAHTLKPVVIKPGKTYRLTGEPELCGRGFHASRRLMDALAHHSGPIVCRVELSGRIEEGSNKMCATRRKVLWMVDAGELIARRAGMSYDELEQLVSELPRIEE